MEQYPLGIQGQEIDIAVKQPVNLPVEKLLYTLEDTRIILGGISMGTLYNLRKSGQLKIVKLGRRSFCDRRQIERLVAGLSKDDDGITTEGFVMKIQKD